MTSTVALMRRGQKQAQGEVISNSSNKIHRTWCTDLSRSLYSQFQKKSYKVYASSINKFRQAAKMGGKRNMQVLWIETL